MTNSHSQQIVALLPMKANSVRVKGKNFRDFCGKPLFHWILNSLLEVEEISNVIINTDARAILAASGLTGSNRIVIRDRKPEICGDHVSMNLVIADDVANVPAEIYLMTHTTNPLLSGATISKALRSFKEAKAAARADSLFTVNKVQSRFYRVDGTPLNHDPNNLIPTQELEPWLEENSNLYIFTAESFGKSKSRIGIHPMMFESPRLESIDIDTPADWDFAVMAARSINHKQT